ncbi:C-X-C motif chemokine 13-like [Esox lucius]|uniref:Chemokine interleukin-8-like domain-containing protein n=1 Tax=Esox lucius TaxID=8010 RepID=A0A3P8Y901_ESOLU|nr:C-X-C motif chemokine 13-like [Esox lucius]
MPFTSTYLLVVLTICSFTLLHAIPMEGFAPVSCRCIRSSSDFIPPKLFKRMEILPAGAHCRYTEIIITKEDHSTICVSPEAKWINKLIAKLQKKIQKTHLH